ncbi:MAG: flagellar hook-associated protein FlgL [Betaproteobacteria bacterium]|nr:flagellar hook-associated protein FlgL [Betaproteobacteria bacterium]
MRISTSQMYQNAASTITTKQSDLARIQNQLSSGKRIASLADDPAGAASAAVLRSELAANGQFDQNRQIAQQRLSYAENTLGAIGENLQSARELLVSAGNGAYSDSDRKIIAGQLREGLATLIGLANSADGQGSYLFGGFREDTPPFVETAATVSYVADDGTRMINVSRNRSIGTGFNGADIFMRIPNGNGVFVNSANAGNSGTGTIDGGRVTNAASLTGNDYEIRFQSGASGTTYDIWDTTNNAAVSVGTPYTAPASIALPGMSVNINGTPANGDKFAVVPSGNQDIFTTLRNAITLLDIPANGNSTKISNGLSTALTNMDQALAHMSDARGGAGARLNELDQLGNMGAVRDVDLKSTLSSVEDIDYAKTISDLTVAQSGLDAALASYARIMKSSLFDYLR